MKIILQRDVEKLGEAGDIVEVKDGYARNYLLPRGLAVQATKGAVRHVERVRATEEARLNREREEAEVLAAKVTKTPVQIAGQAGEDGRLFGSVTAPQIADAIAVTIGEQIDRRRIHLEEPIRSTGTHEVEIRLHPEVHATLTVVVVAQ